MARVDPAEPIDNTDPAEPIESTDPTEPIESSDPADSTEPTDAADSTDPSDAHDSTPVRERGDHRERDDQGRAGDHEHGDGDDEPDGRRRDSDGKDGDEGLRGTSRTLTTWSGASQARPGDDATGCRPTDTLVSKQR